MHVEKFFARNLGGLTRARSRAGPAREGKSRTPSMYADEKSDEAIVPWKRSNNGRQLPAERTTVPLDRSNRRGQGSGVCALRVQVPRPRLWGRLVQDAVFLASASASKSSRRWLAVTVHLIGQDELRLSSGMNATRIMSGT